MSRYALWLSLCLSVCVSFGGQAQNSKPAAKLKALFISGGGYHDFQTLVPFLTGKMSELSSVQWEVKWDPEVLKEENFSYGFDAVVYDMCFDQIDPMSLEHALKATRSGKPTVAIHCAMHSFKASDEWRRLLGMTTRVHDPYQAIGTEKVNPDHPVIRSFPDDWKTPGDELYQTISVEKGADVLLTAKSPSTGNIHTVCWTNRYGQGRVFATTLGHDMKTAEQPVYHQLLTRGLLWACDKLDKGGRPLPGYAGPGWK